MTSQLNAPYWITKNKYEAVAIGMKKVLGKWKICAIQYFRQDADSSWEATGKGISIDKNHYASLVTAGKSAGLRLTEPGEVFSITKSSLEELRVLLRTVGKQMYIALKSFVREPATNSWIEIGEEINIPVTHYPRFMETLQQIGANLEMLRQEERAQDSNPKKPQGRRQYYIDERGFLISKQQWDEMRS
ncbi:MAG: hypothetical protein KIT70_02725 [Anaerolineales bacterium]|nr:MAG: hypothetical protein KIT70_02725 [Anaerolineales bacterium]